MKFYHEGGGPEAHTKYPRVLIFIVIEVLALLVLFRSFPFHQITIDTYYIFLIYTSVLLFSGIMREKISTIPYKFFCSIFPVFVFTILHIRHNMGVNPMTDILLKDVLTLGLGLIIVASILLGTEVLIYHYFANKYK